MTTRSANGIPTQSGDQQGERGIALLLTLGMLSMLMLLAMAFAFTANTDRMAASVNSDITKARLLCKTGIERGMTFLSYGYDGTEAGDIYPATKTGAGLKDYFDLGTGGTDYDYLFCLVSKASTTDQVDLAQAMTVNLGFDYTCPSAAPTLTGLSADASWHHINDADGNLIGRIAFLVIDESGKLDPNTALNLTEPFIDENSNGTWEATEPLYDWVSNSSLDTMVAEASGEHWGFSTAEIDLTSVITARFGSAVFTINDLTATMHSNASAWFDWRHIAGAMSSSMSPSEARSAARILFPASYDIEAFWSDGNTNGTWDSGEDKARFNLNTNWTSVTVANLLGAMAAYSGASSSSINWLAQLHSETAGISDAIVQYQTAANLIDYCDSVAAPATETTTNNYGTGTWATTPYVGLEQFPYLNEIFFTAQITGPDAVTGNYTLEITAKAELINLYESAVSGYNVRLLVTFAEDTIGNFGPHTFELTSGSSVPANGYLTYTTGTTAADYTYSYDLGATNSVANLKIVEIEAYSYDTTLDTAHLRDYAHITTESASASFNDASLAHNTYVEVSDPRANTTDAAWAWGVFDTTAPSAGSETAQNDADDPTVGPDLETASSVVDVSTAYIRDGAMRSLWELGCIHRGEPWRTLNLHLFDELLSTDATYGEYAEGDANILSQVKLGSQADVHGRVNANSPYSEVWAGLLTGMTVGGTYLDPTLGTAISAANAADLATAIRGLNGSTGGSAFDNRGKIASVAALSDGSEMTQANDAEQEEIIGKLAHLLTVRTNYFRIVVTAQAVKDLVGVGTPATVPSDWVEYSTGNYCRLLAEQKVMALVRRDAINNTFQLVRFEYLED